VAYIKNYLTDHSRFSFKKLTKKISSKIEVIATFLAVLEMIKNGIIKVIQDTEKEELWIRKV
jgi:segregation and condensation protein A